MQKKKQKQNNTIKQIILYALVVIIAILLTFAEDIVKLANKNKVGLLENTPDEMIVAEPNIPILSAGMIPIKWETDHYVITTMDDNDWYDYKSGKPAYIMLNDGVYQSELVRNMEANGQKLADENVGNDALVVPDNPNNNPTILMWIPRFAINDETNDIKYIKDVETAEEGWTIPEMFTYKQEKETAPDFLLTGIWFEIDVDTNYTNKINQMNQEESIYGFIKNTIAVTSDQTTGNEIQNYYNTLIENTVGVGVPDDPQTSNTTNNANAVGNDALVVPSNENTSDIVGASIARTQIDDITNPNRIILKIINQKNQDPIKAKGIYDKETGVITIQVTYTKNGIAKILDEDGNTLSENSKTADTGDKILEKTEYTFTIIDKVENKKKLKVTGVIPVFYGKEVTNYNCSVEGIKWRIFHKDDENIYLIADDYIPYSTIPTSTNGNALNKSSDYKAYFTNILNDYTGSEWILNNTNKNAQRWLSKYLTAYPNGGTRGYSMKAVAYMMDTDSWSIFAGSNAEYAIGGPTLELFCASYKVTHPDKYIECDCDTEAGYKVKFNDSTYSSMVSGLVKNDFNSIYINYTTKAIGMWVVSPMNSTVQVAWAGYNGYISYRNYNDTELGFRPIVCIKSGIGLQNNGNGTYRLDIPIEARAYYDETEEKMKIEVTYTKNGISKILDEKGNTLSENSLTAETTILRNGTYKYTVVDKLGNTREITAKVEGLKKYIIPDLETLKEFRDEVNAGNNFSGITVIQTADIAMNEGKYTINEETGEITFNSDAEQWEPIGNYPTTNNWFVGDYDGQGHTISGIYINSNIERQGLFGYCANGTIKNLNINNSKITSTANYVGAIAGYANSIENCSNSGEITSSGCTGGIAGAANATSSATIINCYNTGKITSTNGATGGITGQARNISNCYNTGEISSTGYNTGGIAGSVSGSIISNCYNTGKISSTGNSVGGIFGYLANLSAEVKNCYNIGEICGKDKVAGIIGEGYQLKSIKNCYNIANISSTGEGHVAGIVGYSYSIQTIDKCYNLGNIDFDGIYCAGILGYNYYVQISNCYNTGEIKGREYIGGIAGMNFSKISSSYNTGKITAINRVGGVAGQGANTTIEKNYNVGKVEGTTYKGGILGYNYVSSVLTNNYCETGTADYGIGYPQSNSGCAFGTRDEIIQQIQALDEFKNDEYNINNGYPILSWQTDNDKLNLINGDNAFIEDTNGINNGFPILAWQAKASN